MTIVRCEVHKPKGRKGDYVVTVRPTGYPTTALICGSTGCEQPGLVWLKAPEKTAYDRGQRIFKPPTMVMKMQVE